MTSGSANEPASTLAVGPAVPEESASAQAAPSESHAAMPPRLPADQGLSGLGILMNLGGIIFVFGWIFAATAAGIAAIAASGIAWLVTLFMVLGIIRARLQASAGRAIITGHAGGALAPLRKYVRFGLIHAASAVVLLAAPLSLGMAALIAALLAIWPATMILLVLRTPIAQTPGARGIDETPDGEPDLEQLTLGEKRYKLPLPADNGYESLALLMLVVGLAGAGGLLVVAVLTAEELISGSAAAGPSACFLLLLLVLAFRSFSHVRAALAGLRGATTVEFEERAVRYANVGVITAYAGAACIVLTALMSPQPVTMGSVIVPTLAAFWCLLVWPRIVAHFVRERSLAEILATGHTGYRAEDKGLTALGWLLLGCGILNVATPLFATGVVGAALPAGALEGAELDSISLLLIVGLPLVCGASMIVAGVGFVRMIPRFRRAAQVFVAVGLVTAVIGNWESVRILAEGHLSFGNAHTYLMHVAVLTMAFLLPITTWVLMRRSDKIPSARAVFRS